jgi:hypothetical protein
MFTTDECRAKAKEKANLAKKDSRRRRHFLSAARAWLFLADQIEFAETEMQIAGQRAKENVDAAIPEGSDTKKAEPQHFERGDAQA